VLTADAASEPQPSKPSKSAKPLTVRTDRTSVCKLHNGLNSSMYSIAELFQVLLFRFYETGLHCYEHAALKECKVSIANNVNPWFVGWSHGWLEHQTTQQIETTLGLGLVSLNDSRPYTERTRVTRLNSTQSPTKLQLLHGSYLSIDCHRVNVEESISILLFMYSTILCNSCICTLYNYTCTVLLFGVINNNNYTVAPPPCRWSDCAQAISRSRMSHTDLCIYWLRHWDTAWFTTIMTFAEWLNCINEIACTVIPDRPSLLMFDLSRTYFDFYTVDQLIYHSDVLFIFMFHLLMPIIWIL